MKLLFLKNIIPDIINDDEIYNNKIYELLIIKEIFAIKSSSFRDFLRRKKLSLLKEYLEKV